MAHWAELDASGVVLRVTVGSNEDTDEGYQWLIDNLGGTWVKTSYNSQAGKHIDPDTGDITDEHYRYNYAGVGYTFDPDFGDDGAFIPPSPFPSWVIDETTATWVAPIPRPDGDGLWVWDEDAQEWIDANPDGG